MSIQEQVFSGNFERLDDQLVVLYTGPEMLTPLSHTTRGEPGTFGSTPFNPFLATIADQQRTVIERHDKEFHEAPEYVRSELVQEIIAFNYSRVHHRTDKNFDSFECREHYSLECIPDELRETAQRAITGHGSPAENLVVADILGMPSVELASTTHAYGNPERMCHMAAQRKAVEEAIAFFGGVVVPSFRDPNKSTWSRADDYQIKGEYTSFDSQAETQVLEAFRMTRTRTVGIVDGYRIYERSSFELDVSKLSPELIEAIQQIESDDPNRHEHILAIPGLYKAIKTALSDDDYGTAVPVATTIWAVHMQRERELRNEELRRHHAGRNRQDNREVPFDAEYGLLGLE